MALLVFVACGGGGKKKAASTTSTSVVGDFCTLAREFAERTQPALAQDIADASGNPTAFQAHVRDDFRAANRQIGQLAAAAPTAIKVDMNYMASVFDSYEKALEAAQFVPDKVEIQARQRLSDIPYQEASKRVNDYAEGTCGLTTTTTEAPTTTILATTTTRRPTTTSRPTTTTTVPPTTTTPAADHHDHRAAHDHDGAADDGPADHQHHVLRRARPARLLSRGAC